MQIMCCCHMLPGPSSIARFEAHFLCQLLCQLLRQLLCACIDMQVGELSICMTAEALWNLTACLRFCIRFQTHKAKLVLQTGLQLTVLLWNYLQTIPQLKSWSLWRLWRVADVVCQNSACHSRPQRLDVSVCRLIMRHKGDGPRQAEKQNSCQQTIHVVLLATLALLSAVQKKNSICRCADLDLTCMHAQMSTCRPGSRYRGMIERDNMRCALLSGQLCGFTNKYKAMHHGSCCAPVKPLAVFM